MTRWAGAVFGVLVAATFAAFFVAQRLKNAPTVVQGLRHASVFSPNRDGRLDRMRITFKVKKADDVTVQIVQPDGDLVRTLLDDRHLEAYEPITPALSWDGRDDDGRVVADGRYRIRIVLRRQGRSLIDQRSIIKDTTPPRPLVTAIGPDRVPGPELLPKPHGGAAVIHVGSAVGRRPRILIFRTGPGAIRPVRTASLEQPVAGPGDPVAERAKAFRWDGRDDAGRLVGPGTYLAVAEWRDEAGNIGTSVPLDRSHLPILRTRGGAPLPGRGGITVRYLAARPPVTPAKARDRITVFVDARGQRFSWTVRRLGGALRARSSRPKTRPPIVFSAPGGASGAYILDVRTAAHRTQIVLPVQARRPQAGTAAKPHGVLVVLPFITWQGRNPVDDDGDGAPNTLDLGVPVLPFRVMAGDGLPSGFRTRDAPILQWLDRTRRRYDVTTDLALLAGRGPRLTGHTGVLLLGDTRWLPARVGANLRTFVRRGGTLVSTGIDSLRRTVALDAHGRLTHPSAPRPTDLFGARLQPLRTTTTNLENFEDDPAVGLFEGGTGQFTDIPSWEPTARSPQAEIVSRAVTTAPDALAKTVIAASRQGRGLVIRPGFPSFAARLSTHDPAVGALMARMWTLLRR